MCARNASDFIKKAADVGTIRELPVLGNCIMGGHKAHPYNNGTQSVLVVGAHRVCALKWEIFFL